MRFITLITDYGARDYYAGALKGVIASIAPQTCIVDITHEVEPHHVAHGAFVLRQVWSWFPPGTVHLAVVDPGVGTARRVIVAKYANQHVVAPDNGLVTWVHGDFTAEALHVVEDSRYFLPPVSATFHGRDIMAPVAAHLALGVEPAAFGGAIDTVELLSVPRRAEQFGDRLRGQIIYVDRFGNLVTNVHQDQIVNEAGAPRPCRVRAGGANLGELGTTFGDVPAGQPLCYVGSAGFLEVAINQGRAADHFQPLHGLRIDVVFA